VKSTFGWTDAELKGCDMTVDRQLRDVDDPGWRGAVRMALWMFVPYFAPKRLETALRNGGHLFRLRAILLTFGLGVTLIGVVVIVLDAFVELVSSVDGGVAAAGVIALSLLSLAVVELIRRRDLDCSSDETLVGSFQTRFFMNVAVAEAAALVGFVGFVLTANPLVFAIGYCATCVGFVRGAPTAAALRRDVDKLQVAGCGRSLLGVLRNYVRPKQSLPMGSAGGISRRTRRF
jgi:hypothetical protein